MAAMNLERLWIAALLVAAMPVFAADPNITPAEREKAIDLLEKSQAQLLQAVDGLSAAQWKWKPSRDRWSVGEVAEHLVLAESMIFDKIQGSLKGAPNPDWETKTAGKTALLERVLPTRMGKATAPEDIVPSGKMTREEFRRRFEDERAKTIQFARTTEAPLKEYTSENPVAFGTLNAYQWLLYIPWHTQRHIKQIEEVKSTPGFPKE